MTPEQITERMDQVITSVADAWITMYRFQKEMKVYAHHDIGSASADALLPIREDIWTDMGLDVALKTLRDMERDLLRREAMYLPEHFDRLRSGTP